MGTQGKLALVVGAIAGLSTSTAAAGKSSGVIELDKVVTGSELANQTLQIVRADADGGKVEVTVRHSKSCQERYRFTWTFDRDIGRLKVGDSFDVTLKAEPLDSACVKVGPWVRAGGVNGNTTSLLKKAGVTKKQISNTTLSGGTDRVFARHKNKGATVGAKTAKVKVKKSYGGYTWFNVRGSGGASGFKGQDFRFEALYLFKEASGTAKQPATGTAKSGLVLQDVYTGSKLANKTVKIVRADADGGKIEVTIRHSKTCQERYQFTWTFDRDIKVLQVGDRFDVTLKAEPLDSACTKIGPWVRAGGVKGNTTSLLKKAGVSKKQVSNTTMSGGTDRVFTRHKNKGATVGVKTATISVNKSYGGYTWFNVRGSGGASGFKGQDFRFEALYLYKEQ